MAIDDIRSLIHIVLHLSPLLLMLQQHITPQVLISNRRLMRESILGCRGEGRR